MRWIIGITLAWFVIVNLANLKQYLQIPSIYYGCRGGILAAALGLAGSLIGLAGIILGWGL